MKHGCHGRPPLRDSLVVQSGWITIGHLRQPVMVRIPDPMTRACQYAISPEGQVDPRCEGCRNHASGSKILPYTSAAVKAKENP